MKRWIIERLGGFPTIDDAITAIQERDLEERRTILSLAVRRLFNTIGPDDILREDERGQWVSEGKVVPKAIAETVMSEARNFQESKLWGILQRDIRYQANRKMFIVGTTEMDIAVGKVWLYSLDAIATRLKSLAAGSGKFNSSKQ